MLTLQPPAGLKAALAEALASQLLPPAGAAAAGAAAAGSGQVPKTADLAAAADAVWGAALRVYASQYGAGAESALRAAGLPRAALRMGVLLQPVADLRYAFVAHTRK